MKSFKILSALHNKKSLRLGLLFLSTLFVMTASAAVYYGLQYRSVSTISKTTVAFCGGCAADFTTAGGTLGTNNTYVKLTSIKGYPNATGTCNTAPLEMGSKEEREAIKMRRFKTAARTTKAFVVLLAVLALGLFGVGMFAFAAPSLPAPTISAHPANPTNVTTATFTYTDSSSISSFQCSIDGSVFSLCGTTRPSTKSYPGLAPGAHQF